jgi:hypothetical protein
MSNETNSTIDDDDDDNVVVVTAVFHSNSFCAQDIVCLLSEFQHSRVPSIWGVEVVFFLTKVVALPDHQCPVTLLLFFIVPT